jgi:RNA polymerase sigma factor for flagellar operon FliA
MTERDALIDRHLHLVPKTVKRLVPRVPVKIDVGDLESVGYVALIKAADAFDPARGVSFRTWAISKVRGAVLEYLRTDDWVPRRERDKERAGEPALIYQVVSLDALIEDPEGADPLGLIDRLADPAAAVESEVPERLEAAVVAKLVECLPRRYRQIVRACYWEDITLAKIAQQLDRSPSCVHQLRAEALHLLKAQLVRWRPDSYASR